MDQTFSYQNLIALETLSRFEFFEVRNAASIISSTNPKEWIDVLNVLSDFRLTRDDILGAGKNKSDVAKRLDEAFRAVGWRETKVDTLIELKLTIAPYKKLGEKNATEQKIGVANEGYKVDNFKGRVVVDVEWNAKDGNLDRDLSAYRSWYDAGLIDGGIIITRTQEDLRKLALSLDSNTTKFATTTTTNIEKNDEKIESRRCGRLSNSRSRSFIEEPLK